jgi:dTDP-4-dehydrorhamnose reductase
VKALVTGASGQLGRALRAAPPEGIELVSFGSEELDITDQVAVMRAVERTTPDVILNAAAYTAVDLAECEEARALAVNCAGVAHLASAARDAGARLVHVSSDFVFDGDSGRPYRPDDPAAPLGVYGWSKLAGEEAARANGDSLIVRTSWVYSAHGSNFVTTMLRLMHERDELRVVTDQVGTPTWATSLAQALWQLVNANARGIMHFSDSGVCSWYDFAVAIHEEAVGAGLLNRTVRLVPIATAEYPTRSRRPPYSVLDKARTWQILGAPAPHWRENLRLMLKEIDGNG